MRRRWKNGLGAFSRGDHVGSHSRAPCSAEVPGALKREKVGRAALRKNLGPAKARRQTLVTCRDNAFYVVPGVFTVQVTLQTVYM